MTMTPSVCPCCGYNLKRLEPTQIGDLFVDGEFGGIYWKGHEIELSPLLRVMFFALIRAYPRTVTLDGLAEAGGFEESANPHQNARVYKDRIVRRFRVVDRDFSAIEVVWGVGVRFNLSPLPKTYPAPPRVSDPGTRMRRLSGRRREARASVRIEA